jgi:hypothetical protein
MHLGIMLVLRLAVLCFWEGHYPCLQDSDAVEKGKFMGPGKKTD